MAHLHTAINSFVPLILGCWVWGEFPETPAQEEEVNAHQRGLVHPVHHQPALHHPWSWNRVKLTRQIPVPFPVSAGMVLLLINNLIIIYNNIIIITISG
jgi:hypothetical protein